MKKIRVWILLIFCIILTSCEKPTEITTKQVPLKDGKYLISFSGSDMYQFQNSISILYTDNSVKEMPLNTSMVIENAIENNGEYYFYSRQKNNHYRMMDSQIEEFSILEDVYKEGYYGILYAYPTDNGCIQIQNIGVEDGVYVTNIIRTNQDQDELVYKTENKIACSILVEGDFMHIAYIDLNTDKPDSNSIGISGILTLDLENKMEVEDYKLPNQYRAEPDRPIVELNGDIVVYTQELTDEGFPTGKSFIAVYNDGELKTEFTVENFEVLQSYVYNEKLYMLGEGGMVKVYDQNYDLLKEHTLKVDGMIRKIYFKDNDVYLAIYGDDYKIYINKYDLDSGSLEETDEIHTPTVIDWEIENFAFIPI